jgi:hypothetical protein
METELNNGLTKALSDIAGAIKGKRSISSIKPIDFSTEIFMIAELYLAPSMLDGRGSGLSAIKEISISQDIKKIEASAFKGMVGIERVSAEGASIIGDEAFNGCTSLISATFTEGLETIGKQSFESCAFSTFDIPDTVESIGYRAFNNCKNLTTIVIPANVVSCGIDSASNTQDNAFAGCDKLESISVEEGNTTFRAGNGINALIMSDTNVLVTACKNTNIPSYVTKLGNYAFRGIKPTNPVEIPSQITDIGTGCFSNSVISEISFEEGCQLTIFKDSVFNGSSLQKIEFPEGISSVGSYCFQYCGSLKEVVFSKGIKTIGVGAFASCSKITKYDFSNFEGETLPTLGSSNSLEVSSNCKIVVPDERLEEWMSTSDTNWVKYKGKIISVTDYNSTI